MNIRTGALLLALAFAAPALADIVTEVRAVEVTTSNVIVPTTPNGRLTFKPCAGTCEATYESARLTPETRYRVGDQATDFAGFRKAFFNLARGASHYALVSVDVDANTVTSVAIAD